MKIKKIGIVSLSSGILGEDSIKHELEIGKKRISDYGIELEFLPHALKGMDFIKDKPKCRAQDLITAFEDDSIDMILCAIELSAAENAEGSGGEDGGGVHGVLICLCSNVYFRSSETVNPSFPPARE